MQEYRRMYQETDTPSYERVARAIDASGIKRKVIAERLGVSDSTLSTMLSGKRKILMDEFLQICLILQTDPLSLYFYSCT